MEDLLQIAKLLAFTAATLSVGLVAVFIYFRREVERMEQEQIATDELVNNLADALLNAQAAEANAEDAAEQARAALADLKSKVTLKPETLEKVGRALGNAVAAPPG